MLGRSRIADHFDPAFFKTQFWLMWCTTFAFQPCHSAVEFKRYLLRFVHRVDIERIVGKTGKKEHLHSLRAAKGASDRRYVSRRLH